MQENDDETGSDDNFFDIHSEIFSSFLYNRDKNNVDDGSIGKGFDTVQ